MRQNKPEIVHVITRLTIIRTKTGAAKYQAPLPFMNIQQLRTEGDKSGELSPPLSFLLFSQIVKLQHISKDRSLVYVITYRYCVT